MRVSKNSSLSGGAAVAPAHDAAKIAAATKRRAPQNNGFTARELRARVPSLLISKD
jgi:hypothetical protein